MYIILQTIFILILFIYLSIIFYGRTYSILKTSNWDLLVFMVTVLNNFIKRFWFLFQYYRVLNVIFQIYFVVFFEKFPNCIPSLRGICRVPTNLFIMHLCVQLKFYFDLNYLWYGCYNWLVSKLKYFYIRVNISINQYLHFILLL
jgi:hypothetical protein